MVKIASKGTKLQLSIASTFTDIVQMVELTGPGPEVKTFNSTALDSGTGEENEVTGFVSGGNVSFAVLFDPVAATHQALTDLITTPAVASWKEIWSDAANTEWPFNGILTKFEPKAALEDGLRADCEILLDGMVTYPT